MVCIYCGEKTKVVNSRHQKSSNQTWRRLRCTNCQSVVTSLEHISLEDALMVEKQNGTIEPFARDKLFLSIYKAVDHLRQPVISAGHLTNTVLRHLQKRPLLSPMPTKSISSAVSLVLKRYDAAASVRYLSFQTPLHLLKDIRKTLK